MSYGPVNWSEYKDSNLGPLAPKASALPSCAILRYNLAHSVGVEPTTNGVEVRCSIQLSYERITYYIIKLTVNQMVRLVGVEPTVPFRTLEPKSRESPNSSTGAYYFFNNLT